MQAFDEFFRMAAGHTPHGYQARIAGGGLPDVVQAPTGTGKTGIILAWLWRRLHESHGDRTPRRLLYALPQRSLVEQVAGEARRWLANLGLADRVALHVVMGGAGESQRQWRLDMHRPAIVIGTVDSLVSKALNRGYGIARASYPVDFALVTNGAHWVIDEIQLCRGVDDHAAAACRVREDVRHGGAVRADLHVGHCAGRAAGDRGQSGARRRGRDLAGGAYRGAGPAPGRGADDPAAGRRAGRLQGDRGGGQGPAPARRADARGAQYRGRRPGGVQAAAGRAWPIASCCIPGSAAWSGQNSWPR